MDRPTHFQRARRSCSSWKVVNGMAEGAADHLSYSIDFLCSEYCFYQTESCLNSKKSTSYLEL